MGNAPYSVPVVPGVRRHVVVVGAGIVGASTAWHLARKGYAVTLVDREPPRAMGDGASGGNAGLLSIGHYPLTRPGVSWRGLRWMFSCTAPLYIKPRLDRELVGWLWNFHLHCNRRHLDRCMKVLCAMGWQTLDVLEGILKEESIACDYARDGWLDVVMKPENMAKAEAEARSLEPFGYRWERLEGDALRRRDPCFADTVAGAIHMKDSAHCAPHDLIAGLVRALPKHGVALRFDTGVKGFAQTRGGTVTGVALENGEMLQADATVLCAGVWSDGLARLAGLRIPMQGARGYHLQFDYPADAPPPMPSTGMVLHETFVAITPMQTAEKRQLRLAGTLEIGPLGQPWMRERLEMLVKGSTAYLRGLDRLTPSAEWAGYRPCTSDGMPVIGGVRSKPGLFVATGHAMMGMTLGPVTGKAMAEIVAGEKPCFDVSMLGAERFN
ncbi:MAG: NAD(P)/FAD-dependent oxidoreductase [Planctomycetota bacterium]